jgi:DNA-binding XRE family transcriptional regulator
MQAQGTQRGAVGRAIRDARCRLDMTQEGLALESGLQRKTIHQIEAGKADPRLGTLFRIAAAVKVGVVDLLGPSRDV